VPLGDRAAHGAVDRNERRQVGIGAPDHEHLRGLAGTACGGGGLGTCLRQRRAGCGACHRQQDPANDRRRQAARPHGWRNVRQRL
jgi:hypothetical protein